MNTINDGGPAFPSVLYSHERAENWSTDGMSLRDWFATQCPLTMPEAWQVWTNRSDFPFHRTISSAEERQPFFEYFALLRFEYADAMLAERAKGGAS